MTTSTHSDKDVNNNGPLDWSTRFSHHPIFQSSASSSSSSTDHDPHPSNFVIINQTDLIVSIDHQLRYLSLINHKSNLHLNRSTPDYKLLSPKPISALPTQPIVRLIPNPKSRLLALCSIDQVSVLTLPRFEELSDSTTFIDCLVTSIGTPSSSHASDDYHQTSSSSPSDRSSSFSSSPSSPSSNIMKVLWHEWSHRSSTILILYASGIVLEYDVSRDAQIPTQIIDFNSLFGILPDPPLDLTGSPEDESESVSQQFSRVSLRNSIHNKPKPRTPVRKKTRSSRDHQIPSLTTTSTPRLSSPSYSNRFESSKSGTYGPSNLASTTAVSMCFGTGSGDWGPLTLYGIMQNGDMYAICPYLPKNSVIPLSYRNSLLFFLTAKLKLSSTSDLNGSLLVELQARIHQSLDYLNSLYEAPDLGLDDDLEAENLEFPKPNRQKQLGSNARSLRQGPFLMMPSPIETNENEEEIVSDLAHFRYSSSSLSSPQDIQANDAASDPNMMDSVGVFLIAYQNRIDVCLEVEKIEPQWASFDSNSGAAKSGNNELPMLITYECIDLGLAERLNDSSRDLDYWNPSNRLSIVLDVRYMDTFYVYHPFGIHAISTMNWVESLLQVTESESDNPMLKAISNKIGSDVAWLAQTKTNLTSSVRSVSSTHSPVVTSLCVIDDAYLGYALLAMTDDGQLITQQLQHRPLALSKTIQPPDSISEVTAPSSSSPAFQLISAQPVVMQRSSSHPSYVGLLSEPWQVPPLLNQRPSQLLGAKLKAPPDSGVVSSTTMRFAHQVSGEMNQYIRNLIEAVNSGQDRLKLQINEYQRQLDQVYQVSESLESKNSSVRDAQIARLYQIEERHSHLLRRADNVLQKLTDDRNRSLSKEEVKWFAELARMKGEVQGEGDRKGLLAQLEESKQQLAIAKAKVLSEIQKKEEKAMLESSQFDRTRRSSLVDPPNSNKLGESQIVPIYNKLVQANSCICIIKDQISKLKLALASLKV